MQRKKEITIEEREIVRTDKELIATVKRPAEAEAYKMQQLAEGQKCVNGAFYYLFQPLSSVSRKITEGTNTRVLTCCLRFFKNTVTTSF